jgi:hypothetical protein
MHCYDWMAEVPGTGPLAVLALGRESIYKPIQYDNSESLE